MPEIRSLMSSSSSTTRISDAISDPFLLIFTSFFSLDLLRERECQGHFRALPFTRIAPSRITKGDFAPMVFHDLAHNRQAQTRALGAGGDIGLGQPVPMFRRQAHAIV